MAHSSDQHLWDIVRRRCTPLGLPKATGEGPLCTVSAGTPTFLDLHNLTIQEAYAATNAFISSAKIAGLSRLTVVTGRSGAIRKEFPTWVALHEDVRGAAEMNGGGAFTLTLRKKNIA